MSDGPPVRGTSAGPGWFPDPLGLHRQRYWNGDGWSARVWTPEGDLGPDGTPEPERLSWRNNLAELTPPPPAPIHWRAPDFVPASRRRRLPRALTSRPRVARLVAVAATLTLAAGAVAGAGILQAGNQRPTVAPEITYQDPSAGFALEYPERWQVRRRDPGDGIRFTLSAPGAPTTETNTVSVAVRPTTAALPELHTLADQLTEKLRTEIGSVELVSASRSRIANAPALHFVFEDADTSPPTVIEQYVGRTTAGRPLTITITIREPRTAPTSAELRRFVDSIAAI